MLPNANITKDQHHPLVYSIAINSAQSDTSKSKLIIPSEEKQLTPMARSITSVLILVPLPLALLSGVIFRYSIISVLCAFLLLTLPWLGPITDRNIRTRYRLLILVIGLISLLTVIAQIIFQSIVFANKSTSEKLDNCTELAEVLRYFGLESLRESDATRILRLIFPDIIILAVSVTCFVIIQRTITVRRRQTNELLASGVTVTSNNASTRSTSLKLFWPRLLSVLRRIRLFLQFLIIGVAAFMCPSIINSIYFVFFLIIAFIWSFSIKLGRKYTIARALLVIYTGIHLLIFYLYQFGFFQDALPPFSLWSNITGFTAIVRTNCTKTEPYLEKELVWTDYVNPCALLFLYFYFAFETNRTLFRRERPTEIPVRSVEQESLVRSTDTRESTEPSPAVLDRRWSLELPGDQSWSGRTVFILFSIVRVLERQSYLLSLISMLAWSITYHSLLTLVYLLWACLLWVLPNSRQWCLRMSPFFTFYGACLLILQYLTGFKVAFADLHLRYGNETMEQIGIKIDDFQPAIIPLLTKSFYMIFFWLTLRQYIDQRRTADVETNEARPIGTSLDSYPRRLGQWLVNCLTKYWIFLSCGMLLLVSTQGTVVMYRIVYMVFYLFFILSFQISFGFWKRTAATFHLTIIIYSMVILIGLYIYQFRIVQDFLCDKCNRKLLESIGLEELKSEVLAARLLTPSIFLVINILQLYYFHSDYMKLITMPSDKNIQGASNGTLAEIHAYARENTEEPNNPLRQQILRNEPKTWKESLYRWYLRINRLYKHITYYAWRFSEIHMFKLVLFITVLLSVLHVCAFNVLLIVLVTIGLIILKLRKLVSLLTLIAAGVYILASMCYQLPIAQQQVDETNFFVQNCSQNSTYLPDDTAKWFGLNSSSDIGHFVGLYILLTVALVFDAITRYRQRNRCLYLSVHFNVHIIENRYPILFEPITLKNVNDDINEYEIVNCQQADQGFSEFLKYLANFIFYRFGLEICYMTTVIVIAIRLDIVAVFYALWLGIFLITSRRSVQRMWLFYILFLTIAFPLQYMSAVGVPPFLCFEYPWATTTGKEWDKLKLWLFLPDYSTPPSATLLIADFFQFLFACQQWRVFKYERGERHRVYTDAGGSNREIIYDADVYRENLTYDFVINKRHWLDQLKYAIFMYGAWIVLSIVYLAGITRISLFGLGYLVACFYFFWYGQDFLTRQTNAMLRLWGYLIYYCFSVIFIKACLQVVACIYLFPSKSCEEFGKGSKFCVFVDLLVPCLKEDFTAFQNCTASLSTIETTCYRSEGGGNLFMDGFCLIFLLLQKRIFGSYYWEHIVTELRSQAKLASQGAVLFNELSRKRIDEDREREEQTVKTITESLIRIRKQQLKTDQTGASITAEFVEPTDHFEAIRSGDYYMFADETDHEEEGNEEIPDEATFAQEQILQVLTSTDMETAAAVVTQKTPTSPSDGEEDNQELPATPPLQSEVLPATTMMVTLPSANPEVNESVESKETPPTNHKGLFKMLLIGQIVVDYLTELFNRNSRDYREVSKKLAKMKSERKIIQQEERVRAQTIVEAASTIDLDDTDHLNQSVVPTHPRTLSQPVDLDQRSRSSRFFDSLFYFTMSRSELICYSAMVINHLTSGALLSMPLPLSIFLWAMLSSRPSRNYWISIITYTEAMIVIKYIFQFRSYKWDESIYKDDPLSALNIIGINREENGSSVADLFLLLSLFLHRSILKQLGLWKAETSTSTDDPDSVVLVEDELTTSIDVARIRTSSYIVQPIVNFYRQLRQTLFVRDVYAAIFFCDFINMLIVLGFYSSFGERAGGNVVDTIKENKVPVAFLVILLVQFILIVIDRGLYLRRNVRGKLFFQLFQVIGIHVWLFFVLPAITHTKFRDNLAAQFWYILKCIYFGYSSTQVRLGYPKRIAGNFLMKRFNFVNQILYRVYLLIPFLLELRMIMDWIFTDTALGLSSWLQLEDIYSNIYLLKCARWGEKKYPTERGVPRPKLSKYGVGGSLLVVLILLIWFPLLFFSVSSSFYLPNPPKEVNIEIKLDGYLPIYQMTAQDSDINKFSPEDLKVLREKINNSSSTIGDRDSANAFLHDFDPTDIRCVNFYATSVDIWEITEPIRSRVLDNLVKNRSIPIRYSYTITRNSSNDNKPQDIASVVTGEHAVSINEDNIPVREKLEDILRNGTASAKALTKFVIPYLLPRFLHVKPKTNPEEIESFKRIFPYEYYGNITMGLNCSADRTIPNSTDVWWEMSESSNYSFAPRNCSCSGQDYLTMFFFNDKVSPSTISFVTGYGIIGLYTTFVIVVARVLRPILQTSQTIMYNELPNVERIWHLLRDIYLVREHSSPKQKHNSEDQNETNQLNVSLRTEEQLFAKLLFLYRSPETLIRFTKPKSE